MFAATMLGSVHDNARGYEQKLRTIEHRLSEAATQELRLEQQIAVKLSEVAGLQLEQIHSLEQEARQVLRQRDDEENALRGELNKVEESISGLLEKIDVRQAAIRQAKKQVADSLAKHAEFKQTLTRYEEEKERQDTTASRTRELQDECARKLAGYRQDARYAYLVAANYGTDAYQGSGVARYLDSWIARLCGYHANRRNELTLLAMQEELARAEGLDQQRLQALNDRLAAITAAAEASAGLNGLHGELARLKADVQAEKQRANEIHAQLAPYAGKNDVRYRQARSIVAVSLKSHSAEELMERVRRTPGPADDALAQAVIALQSQLKDQRERIAALEQERHAAEAEYQRAKELERTLRQPVYSGSRYEYRGGLDLASLLMGYMAGHLTMDQAAREITQYRQEVEQDYPYDHMTSEWGHATDDSLSSVFSTSDYSGGGDFSTSDSF